MTLRPYYDITISKICQYFALYHDNIHYSYIAQPYLKLVGSLLIYRKAVLHELASTFLPQLHPQAMSFVVMPLTAAIMQTLLESQKNNISLWQYKCHDKGHKNVINYDKITVPDCKRSTGHERQILLPYIVRTD